MILPPSAIVKAKGFPLPPPGFQIASPDRYMTWAKLTHVPVVDWPADLEKATPQLLRIRGLERAGHGTLEDALAAPDYETELYCFASHRNGYARGKPAYKTMVYRFDVKACCWMIATAKAGDKYVKVSRRPTTGATYELPARLSPAEALIHAQEKGYTIQ